MNANSNIFTKDWLSSTFPSKEKTEQFFEAVFGDADEGAYDISLRFIGTEGNKHEFAFDLNKRTDQCLVCSLTYGLPHVFSRHPIIGINNIKEKVANALGVNNDNVKVDIGSTVEVSEEFHYIPFVVEVCPC